ncbi:FAD-dependent monooxygenase [Candidatus Berkiella cookevillensis]|uniref:2-octaprenylphenol hydroxylase n=1 Tax=Candidatus Berkiella cookevillensis TaxID=437022 RepID=A0A0Q9YAU1_9GAMM|nr:FAD-dependent monooxygenase [Candidatus Berkiella cookevillensis]MCS5709560.1 FAD-dependent monooxygenase [Candidatus Berkiella cookevillensis]
MSICYLKTANNALHCDVIINGGGMVGLTLALLLAQADYSVIILETNIKTPIAPTSTEIPSDLRVVALTQATRQLFESLDIWQSIASKRLGTMENIKVWDQALSGSVFFSALEAKEPDLGVIVEQSVILHALQAALQHYPNVQTIYDTPLQAYQISADRLMATMQNNSILSAKLLVGCDGGQSWVRNFSAIAVKERSYDQLAIVATIQSERPHLNTAYQRFNATGVLALLPLSDPFTLSIVWSVETTLGQSLMMLSQEAFSQQLTQEVEAVLGTLTVMSKRIQFPLREQHATSYIGERVALVGDAAHVIHPLAGQGVNLGFLDAAVLADILVQATKKHRDIGYDYVLKRYQRSRRMHNQGMIYLMRAFKEGFTHTSPLLGLLRNKGLDWVDSHAWLKQFFIQKALGK